jgi:deazaflavin-dependent oxidoreductase (nitroreductase family)
LYLTTVGRRTGRPHRIEIWFAVHSGRLYLLSGGRDRSDWVRNLQAYPQVTVELVAKYSGPEDNLEEWGRTSLPVVIAFPDVRA